MKKKYLLIGVAAASALMLGASCAKEQAIVQPDSDEGETDLKIKLNANPEGPTRAGEYTVDTGSHGKEDKLGTVQLFIFNSGGLEKYVRVNDWDNDMKGQEYLNIGITTGDKEIVAVCNGPDLSAIDDITALRASEFELASCNDPERGFIMYGEKSCSVGSNASAVCSVEVKRFVTKVYLASVTNNLSPQFGSLTLDYAFLSNVPGKCSLSGTPGNNLWLNKYGRIDETPLVSGHIIDGATFKASAPALTFADLGKAAVSRGSGTAALKGLYGLENTIGTNGDKFNTAFSPCGTKLVLATSIGGVRNFYSVNLGKLYRNNVYAVYLTISGQGTPDPAESIVKGNIESTIRITGWQAATPVVEDI